ncbi:hypothetical protein JNUCC0626_20115 [Lentzea sp. JNUCC 0626]|uniref:hypothetical protein n=1 Tax=Lentzea sp. JNUCC 0626 TaxID=3367513 RepID=UPI003748A74B
MTRSVIVCAAPEQCDLTIPGVQTTCSDCSAPLRASLPMWARLMTGTWDALCTNCFRGAHRRGELDALKLPAELFPAMASQGTLVEALQDIEQVNRGDMSGDQYMDKIEENLRRDRP